EAEDCEPLVICNGASERRQHSNYLARGGIVSAVLGSVRRDAGRSGGDNLQPRMRWPLRVPAPQVVLATGDPELCNLPERAIPRRDPCRLQLIDIPKLWPLPQRQSDSHPGLSP